MKKHLFVLFACLFVVSIGFGITMPVLPFYTERLALAGGASQRTITFHVSLLTSVYAMVQFFFAPFWGRFSDRTGRRPLLLLGILGYGISQLLFAVATSLWLLYVARILGGVLSAATFPAASAYVADCTPEKKRGRGMAWLGAAISLGAVVGPALGGMTSRRDWHIHARFGHFKIDGFSVPFFIATGLTLLTLIVAVRWLPESLIARPDAAPQETLVTSWREVGKRIQPLLGLSFISQLGLALFEAIFVLFAQSRLGYGPTQIGFAFMMCGLVMAVFQPILVSGLTERLSAAYQIAIGFGLMGIGIALLLAFRKLPLILGAIGLLALGMSFVSPNLSALVSNQSKQRTGTALGLQNAANNLGQAGGPLVGGILYTWWAGAPFATAAILLFGTGLFVGWRGYKRKGF